jgi:hypothetical protein
MPRRRIWRPAWPAVNGLATSHTSRSIVAMAGRRSSKAERAEEQHVVGNLQRTGDEERHDDQPSFGASVKWVSERPELRYKDTMGSMLEEVDRLTSLITVSMTADPATWVARGWVYRSPNGRWR